MPLPSDDAAAHNVASQVACLDRSHRRILSTFRLPVGEVGPGKGEPGAY